MAYIPLAMMKSVSKSLIHGEGIRIIYRRITSTNNPSTGTVTAVNTDVSLTAVVMDRKKKFIGGSLVKVPGEKVIINAADLPFDPVPGDTVILGSTETSALRRKVVVVPTTETQGSAIVYIIEVE